MAQRNQRPRGVRRPRRSLDAIRGASQTRIRVGFLIVAMVLSVFAVRLFQFQGIDADTYAAKARAVGVEREILPATRGRITDRDGVPLAESLDGLMLVADPTKTRANAAEIATILARRLDLNYLDLVENLRYQEEDRVVRFRYLARRVPSTEANAAVAALEAAGFEGVDTRRDPLRRYPYNDVAANLLGFLNESGEAAEGAELLFDKLLKGKDGSATYDVGGGNRIPLGDNSVTPPRNGQDLTLTIDADVQFYAQRVLRQTVEDAGGESGSVVVMDTRNGELLAVADYPTYDPNQSKQDSKERLGSRALRDAYEPGSVQKVITAAALLDAEKVTPLSRFRVPETIRSSDRVVRDYFEHDTLPLTMTGIIAKSSNVGTVKAARDLSASRLYGYLRAFGLGSRTGIEGYGETAGQLAPWQQWIEIEKDNIAFGQGLSVNAVQMTAAVNAIANGGVYIQPSVVKGTATTGFGQVLGSDVAVTRRVVSEEAAAQTRQMMEMVTDQREGTAPAAAIPGYRVAGKTGTAQRISPDCGCYADEFTVSFAGFAPADDPRFTVYVVVHKPTNGLGGGSNGGPAFRKIMGYLLQHYGVPPTGARPERTPVAWR